jgi:hypothetical protein
MVQKRKNAQKFLVFKDLKNFFISNFSNLGGKQKKRTTGGGRTVKFKNLDDDLASWVRECRSKNLRVSQRLILQKAEKLFYSQDGDFKVYIL